MSNKTDSETIGRTSEAVRRSLTEATAGDRSMTAAAEQLVEAALADNMPLTGRDSILTGFVGRVLQNSVSTRPESPPLGEQHRVRVAP